MKSFQHVSIASVLAVMMVGCATVTPQQQGKWEESMPACYGDSDCKVKWAAARDWVQSNAGYKIQIYSDDLIETYNPIGSDTKIAASVTKKPAGKNPVGDSINAIAINVRCGNVFGCVPNVDQAIMSFNKFVAQTDVFDPSCFSKVVANNESPKIGLYFATLRGKLVVKRVCVGSPAQVGGLKPNDVLRAVNNATVSTDAQLGAEFRKVTFGDRLDIDIVRDDLPVKLSVQLLSKEEQDKLLSKNTQADTKPQVPDTEKKLESLVRMLDKGLITKDEFNSKKKQILQDM